MVNPDQRIWDDILAHLRAHHATVCRQWFDEIESLGVHSGSLCLRVNTKVRRDYLQRVGTPSFNEAALSVSGRLLTVRFLYPGEPLSNGASPTRRAEGVLEPKPGQAIEGFTLDPDQSFENFVTSSENDFAYAGAVAVAEGNGPGYNPLFIHGKTGLGKTHLLQAICLRLLERNPDTRIHYMSCHSFITQYLAAVAEGDRVEFHTRFRGVDVLVVDDIHFLTKRDRTQEQFFHTFNELHQSGRQVILSSDAAPDEIKNLEERLVSRFKSGLVAAISMPCFETRVEIIRCKARMRGIEIPDAVCELLASSISTNVRELEGAINDLHHRSSTNHRPIAMDMALAFLNKSTAGPSKTIGVDAICDVVADFYGVRVPDLRSKGRQRSITIPRQVCMYLARLHTRLSLQEIGGSFGKRHHTTVLHAETRIAERRGEDPQLDAAIRTIEERLGPAPALAS